MIFIHLLNLLFFYTSPTVSSPSPQASTCLASSATEVTINNLFSKGGPGTIVQLCASTTYTIGGTIYFTAANQELSTKGYPTGSTRATIQLGSGNDVSTLIAGGGLNGIKLKNVIVDGIRAVNGHVVSGGGANIEFGGGSNGQIISYVASKNPRAWSCMHIIESGDSSNPCTNATITNNDIGPCGQSGFDAQGYGLWADGISLACTNSLVSANTVSGPTDGGIVLFCAPGTTVSKNTITSSSTYSGFGAINMVDYGPYNGNYSGVVVSGNKITGAKMFSVGIAVGASVWGVQASVTNSGPASIVSNTITGNVTFPIAINGWSSGLTVTGNTVSSVPKTSTYSEVTGCSWPTQNLWMKSAAFSYYSPGISGPLTLQSGFTNSTWGSPTYFLCTQPILPTSISWTPGGLGTAATGTIANVHNGVSWQYQGSDGNLVLYNQTLTSATSGWSVLWGSGPAPGANCSPSGTNLCYLGFQGDGNVVAYFNGTPYWNTGTNPTGAKLVLASKKPYLSVLNGSGSVLWSTG